MKLKVSNEV